MLISAINKHMHCARCQKYLVTLTFQAQIEMTSIAEMRAVFFSIIEEQTKNKMLAEASPDYVFVEVNPSMVPEIRSKPNRALICILITFLGGIFSAVLVLASHYSKKPE